MAKKKEPMYRSVAGILTGGPADLMVARTVAKFAKGTSNPSVAFLHIPLGGTKSMTQGRLRSVLAQAAGKRLADKATLHVYGEEDLDGTLRVVRDLKLDLLVVGRRLPSAQLAKVNFFKRLARKVPCHVMLVTAHNEPTFKRILVPVDFSDHSGMAAKKAIQLRAWAEDSTDRIICQHVYSIPYGYRYSGDSEADFAKEEERHLREAMIRFWEEYRLPRSKVEPVFTPSEEDARSITDLALAIRASMVVVGSRGRSRTASILMGSTAEELVDRCSAPLLIVKEKGETAGFLDAILGT